MRLARGDASIPTPLHTAPAPTRLFNSYAVILSFVTIPGQQRFHDEHGR